MLRCQRIETVQDICDVNSCPEEARAPALFCERIKASAKSLEGCKAAKPSERGTDLSALAVVAPMLEDSACERASQKVF